MWEIKPNTGSLFKNQRKTEERQPDSTGKAMIGGKTYWVSGWVKKTRDGEKWMSLAFKETDEAQQAPTSQGDDPFL